jgi:hypothetical protein
VSKVLSVRVDDELAAEVERVAGERGVKRGVVLEEAVRAHVMPVAFVRESEPSPRPVRIDTPTDAQRWALARQARLNDAKSREKKGGRS